MLEDEIRLIRRLQRTGDRAAADRLIRQYFDEIYRYVYKQTSDKDNAMNLTQNIFIAMLQSIGTYDGRASFRTWLYRIAINKTIDYYRSRASERRYVLSMEGLDIPDETEFTHRIEMKALLARVQRYIDSLETCLQQIFRLKFFGEYTFGQIAAMLGMSESAVKSRYYRLLKSLKEEFGDELD